jgi:excisionase family DNA binding protein
MPKIVGGTTLYTLIELAKMLDITDVTLRRYIKEGKLKATKIGGSFHILDDDLKAFLNGETSTA